MGVGDEDILINCYFFYSTEEAEMIILRLRM